MTTQKHLTAYRWILVDYTITFGEETMAEKNSPEDDGYGLPSPTTVLTFAFEGHIITPFRGKETEAKSAGRQSASSIFPFCSKLSHLPRYPRQHFLR